MQKSLRKVTLVSALAVSLAITACAPIVRKHGYMPEETDLELLVVGVDNQASVEAAIGAPTVAGMMKDGAWYYVASRWETRGAFAPEEVSREVLAISFDTDGVVSNIERFGLEDGNVITLNRRVTNDNIADVTFLRQLLGNIGNFTTEQLLDN